jgi:hypothetical protein
MTTNSTVPETLPYGLDERMALVQARVESRLATQQTEPYGLDERMTVAYLRHEMGVAERLKVCGEIDKLLHGTRPSMQRHDPRSLLSLLGRRS